MAKGRRDNVHTIKPLLQLCIDYVCTEEIMDFMDSMMDWVPFHIMWGNNEFMPYRNWDEYDRFFTYKVLQSYHPSIKEYDGIKIKRFRKQMTTKGVISRLFIAKSY